MSHALWNIVAGSFGFKLEMASGRTITRDHQDAPDVSLANHKPIFDHLCLYCPFLSSTKPPESKTFPGVLHPSFFSQPAVWEVAGPAMSVGWFLLKHLQYRYLLIQASGGSSKPLLMKVFFVGNPQLQIAPFQVPPRKWWMEPPIIFIINETTWVFIDVQKIWNLPHPWCIHEFWLSFLFQQAIKPGIKLSFPFHKPQIHQSFPNREKENTHFGPHLHTPPIWNCHPYFCAQPLSAGNFETFCICFAGSLSRVIALFSQVSFFQIQFEVKEEGCQSSSPQKTLQKHIYKA